jgi:type II secretory pathway pseudopilin PulG
VCRPIVNRQRSRQAGVALLEAIVAMALIAGVGASLIVWINQNLDALSRIKSFYATADVQTNMLQAIRTINPVERPTGSIQTGAYRIDWTSAQRGGLIDQVGFPAGIGFYQVANYDVTVRAVRIADGRELSVLTQPVVGYKKVRSGARSPLF